MQYIENLFRSKKLKISSEKIDIFLIFAQNIDCGYMLEPPHPGATEAVQRVPTIYVLKRHEAVSYGCACIVHPATVAVISSSAVASVFVD